MCAQRHTPACIATHACTRTCAWAPVRTYTSEQMCMDTWTYTCLYEQIYACTRACIQTCMARCTLTCVLVHSLAPYKGYGELILQGGELKRQMGWRGWREPQGLGVSTCSCCGGLFYNHSKNIIQDEGESRLLRASAVPSRGIYHSELGAPPPATPR